MSGRDADIVGALRALRLIAPDEVPDLRPLSGGVSSEIWRVETRNGPICVKRAMHRLRVAAVWHAPLERSHSEAEWLRVVEIVCPGAAPRLLGEDAAAHLIAMQFLDPHDHPLWKQQLSQGEASPAAARAVGSVLGRIHAGTADSEDMARRFATDSTFHAIRLEPYLEATARVHPALAPRLIDLVNATTANKRVLVHGDVSPKNILIGPRGPIFLDAECAWFGDPAFDAAFVLNHLLLKCLWVPAAVEAFLACFSYLAAAYLAAVSWEDPAGLEHRIAALLPGLMLARVDGKSPVEYLQDDMAKDHVRVVASELLLRPAQRLQDIRDRWRQELRS